MTSTESLRETITRGHDVILASWEQQAGMAASARGLSRPLLRNIMPRYLESLGAGDAGIARSAELLERHLSARIREGFELEEILEELTALGRAIAAYRTEGYDQPSPEDLARIFAALNRGMLAATTMFHEHMLHDEQADKRFIRQLQAVSTETPRGGRTPPMRERLRQILEVICEAMNAESVALLLFDAQRQSLETAASVGRGAESLEAHGRELGAAGLAGMIADSDDEPIAIDNVATTRLDVGRALRKTGIGSLLAVRLPSRHRLMGALYVGLKSDKISAREVRRAELLGEQLTLHLYNAELSAELRETIAEMDTDRRLRDRLVSILAHDLRGPLATVRVQAELLARKTDDRASAGIIMRNVDRTDRMVRDLLDTLLIRSGRRLPLEIAECDLATIARDVVEELSAQYGPRFVVRGDDAVQGFWSGSDLRRAIWNLMSNAVKYGARDKPVTVTVRRADGRVYVSIHNEGEPIPEGQRARLFQPFGQLDAAPDSGHHGWGLGLTLVQGVANAHGGEVELESSAAVGTTFTIRLPEDARQVVRTGPQP